VSDEPDAVEPPAKPWLVNELTGEVTLGSDQPGDHEERLLFTEGAIESVEQLNMNVPMITIQASSLGQWPTVRQLRILLWAGINGYRERHGRKPISMDRAGRIMVAAGGFMEVLPRVIDSLTHCKVLGMLTPRDESSDAPDTDEDDDDLDPTNGDD
jgi:hypothetical protein